MNWKQETEASLAKMILESPSPRPLNPINLPCRCFSGTPKPKTQNPVINPIPETQILFQKPPKQKTLNLIGSHHPLHRRGRQQVDSSVAEEALGHPKIRVQGLGFRVLSACWRFRTLGLFKVQGLGLFGEILWFLQGCLKDFSFPLRFFKGVCKGILYAPFGVS